MVSAATIEVAAPVGLLRTKAFNVISLVVVTVPCFTFAVTVFVPVGRIEPALALKITSVTTDEADSAALEGAAEINPKPIADTATSAMRLRSVFVDICFLSISRSEEFPPFGFG
jgi:hypothetical protein